jgi:integrase
MAKPIKSRRKAKPNPQAAKPYPDFPLSVHANGSWCKKIRGKLFYFGPVSDPDAALQKYLDQKDDLHAGRTPRAKLEAGATVSDAANHFLTSKKDKLERGEIVARSFYDLYDAAERTVKHFGKDRLLTDVRPDDFAAFQRSFPRTWGPIARGRQIQHTRSIFLYAMVQGLIQTVVRFGDFKKPSKSVLRKAKAKARAANGLRMFEAQEIRDLLDKAGVQLRAMTLLAVNAGLGPTDLASLTFSVLDLEKGWLDYPRIKSGVDRKCPLWPETAAAVKEAIARRPKPKDEAHASLVFITKYGRPWLHFRLEEQQAGADQKAKRPYRIDFDNAVSKEFDKLQRVLGMKRPGRNIYALRHTLQTVGGEARDVDALRVMMGHADASMSDHYREGVADERLQRVADTVRAWLFVKPADPSILPLTGRAAQ